MRFEVWDKVKEGTAELDPRTMTLWFHSYDDLKAWKNGESFRLIIHWWKPAPVPKGK